MRLIALAILTFSAIANAQYGIGLTPATMCNGGYRPAPAVVDPSGLVANERSRYQYNETKIEQLEQHKKTLSHELKAAEQDMEEVLTATAMNAIHEHREHHNRYASYRKGCGAGARGPVDTGTDLAVFGESGTGAAVEVGITQVAPPEGFCIINPATGQRANVWEKFVEDEGTVSDRICNFRISGIARAADARARKHCREGMHEYYRVMREQAKLDRELNELEDQSDRIARDLRRVSDEITDGTFCWSCHARALGYNEGVVPFINQGNSILQRAGPPPTVLPAGYAPYGGAGYPVRPYQSTLPGYYNLAGPPGAVQYGGIPGGIGAGGFGCGGNNALALGPLLASPNQVPITGPISPVNSPFATPAVMSAFNQGAGPWGFPAYANGVPAFNTFGQPVMIDPVTGQPMVPNQFGLVPPGLIGGPMVGPYSAYPIPGTYPYPGVLGAGSLYGNIFGPGYGSPMWAGLYGGIPGYGPTWAAQPYTSPIYNYYGQMNGLTNRLQLINSGPYYTGGGGYAPVPYLTSPIYNGVTPGVGARPPSVLPYQ